MGRENGQREWAERMGRERGERRMVHWAVPRDVLVCVPCSFGFTLLVVGFFLILFVN